MELKSIQIKNFRSIKDVMIEFDHNCLILLGKNEAGKSNVLKAIAAVFDKHKVSDKDRRKKIDNEKIKNDDYYVRAIISLNNKDIDEIEQRFIKKFTGIENISFKNN
jgi:predicted ATP-dependent endonuclease of OLD family